jgi:hypothetical protein
MVRWKMPLSYGVLGGPVMRPVQWRMFSELEGDAEQDSRGSLRRLVSSLLMRLRVVILALARGRVGIVKLEL